MKTFMAIALIAASFAVHAKEGDPIPGVDVNLSNGGKVAAKVLENTNPLPQDKPKAAVNGADLKPKVLGQILTFGREKLKTAPIKVDPKTSEDKK